MALSMMRIDPARAGGGYRGYVVAVLGVVFAFNVMDRSLLSMLQEPIKRELGLSDGQLGVLSGLAFAAFYATLAIPLGRIADRHNRVAVLTGSLLMWCMATAACGLAGGFAWLLLCRMMVGVGEAGGHPPSASILSDYFPAGRRATALSLYGLGAPAGAMLGLLAGGWVDQWLGWRAAFVIVGLAGALAAPLLWFTIAEPRRGMSDPGEGGAGAGEAQQIGFGRTLGFLWRLKSLRYLLIANMVHGFTQYAFMAWTPPFYARSFGLASGALATRLSVLAALGMVGTWAGGALADRLGRRDMRWQLWVLAIVSGLTVPFGIAQYLAPTPGLSFLFAAGPYLLLTAYVGPTIGASQTLVSPRIRGATAGIMLMTFNIVGLGLGPTLAGLLSDALQPHFGGESLRHAMAAVMLVELIAMAFYLIASRHLRGDLARNRALDFV
jgi:MFS family permease